MTFAAPAGHLLSIPFRLVMRSDQVVSPIFAVTVSATTSDTSVVNLVSTNVLTSESTGAYGFRAGTPGAATVVLSAPGYQPDTVRVRLSSALPPLSFRYGLLQQTGETTIGVGQQMGQGWLWVQGINPDTIRLTQRRPDLLRIPSLVAAQGFAANFDLTGLAAGTDTVIATAAGYSPASLVVHVTPPRLIASQPPDAYATEGPFGASVELADSLGIPHFTVSPPYVVGVRSSDTTIVHPRATSVEVGANTAGGRVELDYRRPGTATLTFTDPTGRALPFITRPITISRAGVVFGVNGSRVTGVRLGTRQALLSGENNRVAVVATHYTGSVLTTVRLRSTNPAIVVVAEADSTFQRSSGASAFFNVAGGDVQGTAWIVAEGGSLVTDSIAITVGAPIMTVQKDTGENRLRLDFLNDAGQIRTLAQDLVLQLSSSDPAILIPSLSTVTIPAGSSSASVRYSPLKYGKGVIRIVDPRTGVPHYPAVASDIIHVFGAP
jgi:hypothetical protein